MAGGYESPSVGEFGELKRVISQLQADVKEIGRPRGSQVYDTLKTLQDVVNGILTATNFTVPGFITAGGAISAGTTIASGGRGTFTGGVTSADVKSRTLSVSYDAVYIDVNNIMGKSPSALRFKQDVEKFTFDPKIIDNLQGYTFRLKGAVEAMGDDAPREHGYIADYLPKLGLGGFARYDEDGEFSGMAYERLIIPAIDSLQDARKRLAKVEAENKELRADLDQIKKALGI